MDELERRLDEISRAVMRRRALAGLDDVRRRATRRRRTTRAATGVAGVVLLVVGAVGSEALGERRRTTVTTPMPSAAPSPTPDRSPSPRATPTPTPTQPSPSPYRRPLPGELPRAISQDAEAENAWEPVDEGRQYGFPVAVAQFSAGSRPRTVTVKTVEAAFGFVWVPADDGVLRIDPETLQPTDYVPTGRVLAIASSGYASMYAAVATPGGGLGVASWEPTGGTVRIAELDSTPGAADSVRGEQSVDGFAELLYITRTYSDLASEVIAVSPANGTAEVIDRFGLPGTVLTIARAPGDGATHLWVGGSDGMLRHIHPDGRVTSVDLGGPIEDVSVTDDHVWAAVGGLRDGSRPVAVAASTERVVADLRDVRARHIAVIGGDLGYSVWASSGSPGGDGVHLTLLSDREPAAFTAARLHIAALHDLVLAGTGPIVAFGVSPATRELVRVQADFGD